MFKCKKVIGFIMFSFLVILNIYALDFSESHAKYVTDGEDTISFNTSISKLISTDVTVAADTDNSDNDKAIYTVTFTRNNASYTSDTDIYAITLNGSNFCTISSVNADTEEISINDSADTAQVKYTSTSTNAITFKITCDVSDSYGTHNITIGFNVKEKIINNDSEDELKDYTTLYYISYSEDFKYTTVDDSTEDNIFDKTLGVLKQTSQYTGNDSTYQSIMENYFKQAFCESTTNCTGVPNRTFKNRVANLKGFSYEDGSEITTDSFNDNYLGYAITWNYFQSNPETQTYSFTTQIDNIRQEAFEYYLDTYGSKYYTSDEIANIKTYVNGKGGVKAIYTYPYIRGFSNRLTNGIREISLDSSLLERVNNYLNPPVVAQASIDNSDKELTWSNFINAIAELKNSSTEIRTAVNYTYYIYEDYTIFNSVNTNWNASIASTYSNYFIVKISDSLHVLLNVYSNSLDYVYGKIFLLQKGSEVTIERDSSMNPDKTIEQIINEIDVALYGDNSITIPIFNEENYTVTTDLETGHKIYTIEIDGIELAFEVYSVDGVEYVKYTIRNS